jgi:hypothetical protein
MQSRTLANIFLMDCLSVGSSISSKMPRPYIDFEIGDKRCSEGGAMVKTTGCYVEFHVKNNSTNSVKSALHRVCTLLLYTTHHVGWTKSWPRNRVRNLENEWLSHSVRGGKNGIWNLCLRLASLIPKMNGNAALGCFRSNLWALE